MTIKINVEKIVWSRQQGHSHSSFIRTLVKISDFAISVSFEKDKYHEHNNIMQNL